MAKLCSNCGAQVGDNVKFCGSCGQAMSQQHVPSAQPAPVQQQPYIQPEASQQPIQPQYQSPPANQPQYPQPNMPAPVQAKSKTPLIIAGAAGLAVIALIAAAVVTKGFGLLGNGSNLTEIAQSDRPTQTAAGQKDKLSTTATTQTGSTLITVPKNASAEEKLAYSYIETAAEFYEAATEMEFLFPYCADSFYAIAAVDVCSMRYAVDCLLEIKGTSPAEDDRLRDWDDIAALGWVSSFPYFFEGVVLEARGDTAGASECYRKARLNPYYAEEDEGLKAIKNLDEKALNGLKATLEEIEDMIFEATGGSNLIAIERNENNFDISYLRKKAAECMTSQEAEAEGGEEAVGAIDACAYYIAALYADPLDGDNYADLAEWYLRFYGSEMAESFLEAGMSVDPTNTRLASLDKEIKEATE